MSYDGQKGYSSLFSFKLSLWILYPQTCKFEYSCVIFNIYDIWSSFLDKYVLYHFLHLYVKYDIKQINEHFGRATLRHKTYNTIYEVLYICT